MTRLFAPCASLAAALSLGLAPQVNAANEKYAQFTKDPLDYTLEHRDQETAELVSSALADPSLEPVQRNRVLMTVGTLALMNGDRTKAHDAMLAILVLNPLAALPYSKDELSSDARKLFFAIQDSVQKAQGIVIPPDIRTIAVGPVEVNAWDATREPRFHPDALARGLDDAFVGDLKAADVLRVLDRQQLEVLIDEIKRGMTGGNRAEPDMQVEAGRLLGAQSFLFTSFQLQDRDDVTIIARWVDTETSEVLVQTEVTAKVRSSKDLLKLEERLTQEVLKPLFEKVLGSAETARDAADKACAEAQNRAARVAGKKYLEYVLKKGTALLNEEQGDHAKAAEAWEAAAGLAPKDRASFLRGKTSRAASGT